MLNLCKVPTQFM